MNEVCTWYVIDELDGEYWSSGCKELFDFNIDGPIENHFKFCPYCGKKIEELEKEYDGDK